MSEQRVYKVTEIIPPVTIEWTREADSYRGDLTSRARVVERNGRNLRTEDGDWLWWPTINRYNDVVIVAENAND